MGSGENWRRLENFCLTTLEAVVTGDSTVASHPGNYSRHHLCLRWPAGFTSSINKTVLPLPNVRVLRDAS